MLKKPTDSLIIMDVMEVTIMSPKLKRVILLLIFSFLGLGLIFCIYIEIYYQRNKIEPIYNDFFVKIKREDYLGAHKLIYPSVINLEEKALKLVSETYYYGLGVNIDLVKANIWNERSKCQCLETGEEEYNEYMNLLHNKNYKIASDFLEKAAKKGNKRAINLLKNDKYLQENKLIIEPIWVNYWKNFDYDNLYPFYLEIEECKNGLIKNQSGLDKQRSI